MSQHVKGAEPDEFVKPAGECRETFVAVGTVRAA
jgi:hypothetical protein